MEEHVTVTETYAEIKLQAILDKTSQRLITAQRAKLVQHVRLGVVAAHHLLEL